MKNEILVAGIGNIFLGDDAFGSEVARRLASADLPEAVQVVDYGIRGFDLAFAMLEEHEAIILVDALPRGEAPGTLYLIEPDLEEVDESQPAAVEPHSMDPMSVLRLAQSFGARPQRLFVVGCEPETLEPDEQGAMGLSAPVSAALDVAVRMVQALVDDLLQSRVPGE